jgi:hypothetical protein
MALERKVLAMYSLWREGPSGSKRIKTEKEKVVWPWIQKVELFNAILWSSMLVAESGRRRSAEGSLVDGVAKGREGSWMVTRRVAEEERLRERDG